MSENYRFKLTAENTVKNTNPNRCWSCLGPLTDENIVEVNHESRLPCCLDCWCQIPVADRLAFVREMVALKNDAAVAKATKAGWDQVREFFRAAQAGELARISPLDFGDSLN